MSLVNQVIGFFRRNDALLNQAAARSKALADQRAWLIKHQREVKERLRRQQHVIELARAGGPQARRDGIDSMQVGFTLIELMVVVAIVGILAVLGIGQYKDYTGRAAASEATNFATAMQTSLIDYYSGQGQFPATITQAGFQTAAGKYVSATNVANGEITVTFANALPVPAALQGTVLAWTPYVIPGGSVAWTCGYATPGAVNWAIGTGSGGPANASAADTTVPNALLPGTCRAGG